MRSREEIEKQKSERDRLYAKTYFVPSSNSEYMAGLIPVIIELLLDIRDMMKEGK